MLLFFIFLDCFVFFGVFVLIDLLLFIRFFCYFLSFFILFCLVVVFNGKDFGWVIIDFLFK